MTRPAPRSSIRISIVPWPAWLTMSIATRVAPGRGDGDAIAPCTRGSGPAQALSARAMICNAAVAEAGTAGRKR